MINFLFFWQWLIFINWYNFWVKYIFDSLFSNTNIKQKLDIVVQHVCVWAHTCTHMWVGVRVHVPVCVGVCCMQIHQNVTLYIIWKHSRKYERHIIKKIKDQTHQIWTLDVSLLVVSIYARFQIGSASLVIGFNKRNISSCLFGLINPLDKIKPLKNENIIK